MVEQPRTPLTIICQILHEGWAAGSTIQSVVGPSGPVRERLTRQSAKSYAPSRGVLWRFEPREPCVKPGPAFLTRTTAPAGQAA
jgi:hypothetical protein